MHASTGCHNSSSVWFFCRTNRPFTKVPLIHRAHQRPLWQLSELLLSSMVACWDENHFHQKHGQSDDIMAICCWAQEWPHTWAIKSTAWLEKLSSKQHRKARNVIHNRACVFLFTIWMCFSWERMTKWIIQKRLTTRQWNLYPGNTLLRATVKYQRDENAYYMFSRLHRFHKTCTTQGQYSR